MDITISGPKGSGKTKLAAYIWPWFEGKRSLVQVHSFAGRSMEATTKTWDAVNADVLVFDGGFTPDGIAYAQNIMQFYRETYNRDAVAIYVIQQ